MRGTYYDEDCCHNHSTSVSIARPGQPAYWSGFLAGPQGPKYRHLLLDQVQGARFYHMNCEHGTGEAICEFAHSNNISVYGLKTEGNFVTLWAHDCDQISIFGSGGAGCSANDTVYPAGFAQYPPTLYRFERTPNFQFANLVDQHPFTPMGVSFKNRHRDMFDEAPCPPEITHMLYDDQAGTSPIVQTIPFDKPALYIRGNPNL